LWPTLWTLPLLVWLIGLVLMLREIPDNTRFERRWCLALWVAWLVGFSWDSLSSFS